MGLYEDLKKIEPFSLSCHHDADGLYSATLLRRIFDVKLPVQLPPFNEYVTEVAVDLGFPKDKNWSGIAIDHHPDHPEDRKYKLYWDYVPTGLVLYNHLREHIKPEDLWLVVGSLTGDGQPERVPDEIWDSVPVLLKGRGIMYKTQWKLGISNNPLFVFLSSGINALCRLGSAVEALNILNDTKRPVDLLENPAVRDAVETVRKEEEEVYRQKPIVESLTNCTLVRIHTSKEQIRLCGLIAAKLMGSNSNETYLVMNEDTGEISIRGVLAKYIANRISQAGYKAGGHPGFCGANVDIEDIPKFLQFVRSL